MLKYKQTKKGAEGVDMAKTGKKKISGAILDGMDKIVSVAAVSLVTLFAPYFLFKQFKFTYWLAMLVFTAVGYGLQAVYGMLTDSRHHSRASYYGDTTYEGLGNYFKPLRAAGPLTLSAIAAVLLYMFIDPFYATMAVMGLVVGIVLWFYPPSRLMSLRMVSGYIVIIWIGFLVLYVVGLPTAVMAPYVLLFAILVYLGMNQTHIMHCAVDTVTVISDRERVYNLGLVSTALITALVLIFFFFAFLLTARFLGSIILFLIARTFLSSGGDDDMNSTQSNVIEGTPSGDSTVLPSLPSAEQFMVVIFVIFFIAVLLILIARGTGTVKRLLAAVNAWLEELFMFFTGLFSFGRTRTAAVNATVAYRDEETRTRTPQIREYEKKRAPARSYKEFAARLNAMETVDEQLRFAYVTLMTLYREGGVGNKASETPREAMEKIASRTSDRDIGVVTGALETVDFAETDLPAGEGERVVADICEKIKRRMNGEG